MAAPDFYYRGNSRTLTNVLTEMQFPGPQTIVLNTLGMGEYRILEVCSKTPDYLKFIAMTIVSEEPRYVIVGRKNGKGFLEKLKKRITQPPLSLVVEKNVDVSFNGDVRRVLVTTYKSQALIPENPLLSPIAYDLRKKAIEAIRISDQWEDSFIALKNLTMEDKYELLHLDPEFILGAGVTGVVLKVSHVASKTFGAMKIFKNGQSTIKEPKSIRKANQISPTWSTLFYEDATISLTPSDRRQVIVTGYGGKTLYNEYILKNPLLSFRAFVKILDTFIDYYSNLYGKYEHGDIKPENILVNDQGQICFTDYGEWLKWNAPSNKFYRSSRPYRTPAVTFPIANGTATSFGLAGTLAEIVTGVCLFYEAPPKGCSPEADTNMHLAQVFSFIPPSEEFIHLINPEWKEKFISKPPEALYPIETSLRKNLQGGLAISRVILDNCISPQEFTDLFVSFLKVMLSYEKAPDPQELLDHPFVIQCHEKIKQHDPSPIYSCLKPFLAFNISPFFYLMRKINGLRSRNFKTLSCLPWLSRRSRLFN